MPPLTLAVYTNVDWEHALAWLRYRAPAEVLGWRVLRGTQGTQVFPEYVAQADVVLIQRGFPQNYPAFQDVLQRAHTQGKPVVYELDDWLPVMPEFHPAFDSHVEQLVPVFLGLFEADLVLVSSEPLRAQAAAFNPRVRLVPNGLPERFWRIRPPKAASQAPVVMGYMGTATHLPDLEAIAPVLLDVLTARPQAHLKVWGCPLPAALQGHPQVETAAAEIAAYPDFAAFFQQQHADFWIAPLLDTPFNRAKSPIKFWEYTATGASGVYQAIAPYADVVEDGRNGLLADTPEAWRTACLWMIDHPAARLQMAQEARHTLEARGMLSVVLPLWEQAFRDSLSLELPAARPASEESLRQALHRVQRRAWQRHVDTLALLEQHAALQQQHAALQQQHAALQQQHAALQQRYATLQQQHRAVRAELQAILNSRSWRFMRRVQRVRETLIPPGGGRERTIKALFRALRAWRRDGTRFTIRRVTDMARAGVSQRYFRWRQRRYGDVFFPVEAVSSPQPVPPRTLTVDVIVCVHNALDDVRRCLESVVRYTAPPYTIILVDDGSDAPTREYLQHFAETQGAILLRNEQARGYTLAANQGLRASTAPYALLLNSDTIVASGWLDSMAACAESDPHIGLVGPLSNTASWQSVPETLNEAGDWADNALPEGLSIAAMAQQVRQQSARLYPRIPFLNGFCLMVKRAVMEDIGFFDEATFGAGYGEENDYCLRARKAGWELAVADDVYIYHAQSKSYSHARRRELARRADEKLAAKHGQPLIAQGVQQCKESPALMGIRSHVQVAYQRNAFIQRGLERWEGRRVLFLLPVLHAVGGGHVIVQEARAMRRMGVDVHILNLRPHKATFEREYPECDLPVVYVDSPRLPDSLLGAYDAVVATVYHTVKWLEPLNGVPRGYYIQDFEPWFFEPATPEYQEAWESYTRFDDLLRITKTDWNNRTLQEQVGVGAQVIGPSLNIDLFRPRPSAGPAWPERPLRIAAMVRPSTPRRQPQFTVDVLREFSRRRDVDIVFFGCDPGDPDFQRWAQGFRWRHAGVLTRPQLVRLFSETDIFLDASAFQAMGLTAMEAMACGAAVIVPQAGGAESFAIHERNALVVDTTSKPAVLQALERLSADHALRKRIQQHAITDICAYTPEQAAYRLLAALWGGAA
ncbi:MAG: hypothetical protein Fur0018_07240 [Anaerolineales bacterium]